jgi:hypothetical protein
MQRQLWIKSPGEYVEMPALNFTARTVRRWLPAILWTSGLCAQTCLSLSPPVIGVDGTAEFELSLYSPRGTAPAAVQWTFQYEASRIASLTVTDGPALQASSKTAICDGDATPHNCLAAGLNKRIIVDGVIAKVTAVLAPGAITAAMATMQITGLIAASAEGFPIPVAECTLVTQSKSLAEKK